MMRLSHYVINQGIQRKNERQQGYQLVFSARTSRFFFIRDDLWGHLRSGSFELIPKMLKRDLVMAEFLVDDSEQELEAVIRQNQQHIAKDEVLYYVIQGTASCPLGCGYCGQKHTARQMSLQNQIAVVRQMRKKLQTGQFKSIYMGWFGAEPLSGLPVIHSMTCMLKELAKEFGVSYASKMTTNGLALTPTVASRLVKDYNVNQIEVTLDGVAEHHDKRRHTKTLQPTFERIYKNIYDLAFRDDLDVRLSIRCNVDMRNHTGVVPLLRKVAADGLHKRIAHFYVAPIHSWGNDAHKLSAEKKQFAQWEIDWFIEMKRLNFKIPGLPSRVHKTCLALDKNSQVIDPEGNCFNCTEVSLVPAYEKEGKNVHCLGHVNDTELSQMQRWNHFGSFYEEVRNKQWPCNSCPIFPVCGGFCPKDWKEGRAACPSIKYNLQDRLLLHYAALKEKKEGL